MSPRLARQTVATVAVTVGLAALSAIFLGKNTDFRVYWYGVSDFLSGGRPLYGPLSGLGTDMNFLYPPWTVLFFLPFTKLPIRIAGILWIVISWIALVWASVLARKTWKLSFTPLGSVLGFLILLPYVVLAIRYGNVQPFLIACVLLALLWSENHPGASGAALALAISFKIWPVLFIPWFLTPPRRRVLRFLGLWLAALWCAPILFFGASSYIALLRAFFSQAFGMATTPAEIWYPSQSLRGVLLRFFTHLRTPEGYPGVSLTAFPVAGVVASWLVLSITIYIFVVWSVWKSDAVNRYRWDAVSFVCISALQPFSHPSSLISLLPTVLMAVHFYSVEPGIHGSRSGIMLLAAGVLSLLSGAVAFYRPWQRELVAIGIYFWIMLAFGLALILARPSPAVKRKL